LSEGARPQAPCNCLPAVTLAKAGAKTKPKTQKNRCSAKGRRFWKGYKPNPVPLLNGENHLSAQPIPETRPLSRNWSGPLRGFLFGLAPDGVFRAASLTLRAVRSYRTFSPSPPVRAGGCLFSVALSVESFIFRPRVSPLGFKPGGYAASRPLVFGLSSFGSRQKRFSALPKPRTS